MNGFFQKIKDFVISHKKTVIAVCAVVVVIAVITACSSIGEADNVQFGFVNTGVEKYGSGAV